MSALPIAYDAPLADGEDWRERALCAQTDPEAFWPDKGDSTKSAKRICMACTVRSECLSWALANGEIGGVWGGLSELERRRMGRTRRPQQGRPHLHEKSNKCERCGTPCIKRFCSPVCRSKVWVACQDCGDEYETTKPTAWRAEQGRGRLLCPYCRKANTGTSYGSR